MTRHDNYGRLGVSVSASARCYWLDIWASSIVLPAYLPACLFACLLDPLVLFDNERLQIHVPCHVRSVWFFDVWVCHTRLGRRISSSSVLIVLFLLFCQ